MADEALSIDDYLKGKGSPLAGLGNVFVAAGRKYGVDPRLMVAISGAESSFGKHIFGNHNAWGWGPGRSFGSWEEGISAIAKGLRTGYLDEGRTTPSAIGAKWAPAGAANDPTNLNSNWSTNVESFLRELGGSPVSTSRRPADLSSMPSGGMPAVPTFELPKPRDFSDVIQSNAALSSPSARVKSLVEEMIFRPPETQTVMMVPPAAGAAPSPTESFIPTTGGRRGEVTIRPGADRAEMATKPGVVDFVSSIAAIYGSPLQIGTGTNHNQYVKGTSRQSRHWTGDAVDIPARGEALTRLGQAALIAAGMPEAEARRKTGGVFNVNGRQVIFNTMTGGNHYDHLHAGL